MTFIIHTDKKLPKPFLNWILCQLKSYIYCNINLLKLDAFDEAVNDKQLYRARNDEESFLEVRKAIVAALDNFRFRQTNEGYIFYLSGYLPFPTHIVGIEEVCKLLNYGSFDIQPYPIFSEAFKYINTNLNELYNQYRITQRYGGF